MARLISLCVAAALLLAPVAVGGGFGPVSSIRTTGTVTGITSTTLDLAADTGQSLSFRLVTATAYELDGQPASLSALQVGQRVEVKYHVEPDGSLKAKMVKIETAATVAGAPVRTRGTVVSVTATTLVVNDAATGRELSLRLDASTIYERGAEPAAWSDLHAGQAVKLKYRIEPDGSLKARKVEIELPAAPLIRFELVGDDVDAVRGVLRVRVRSLRERGAVIAAGRIVAVRVAAGASILVNKRRVSLAALRPGDRLSVSGVLSGSALTAERVVARRNR